MWEKINNFLKGQIVTSLIYIVLGICLVFMPVNMINVICKFVFGNPFDSGRIVSHPDLCCREIKFNDLRSVFRRYPDGTRNFPFYESTDRGKLLPIYSVHLFWLTASGHSRAASNSRNVESIHGDSFCLET